MATGTGRYRFVARSAEAQARHGHPFIVYDTAARLHLPLTAYAREVATSTSPQTARVYLYPLCAYCTFLETDAWQVRAGRRWDDTPEAMRAALRDYLVQRLACVVREHKEGFRVVGATAGTPKSVGILLTALKSFYHIQRRLGAYPHENPLVDATAAATLAVAALVLAEEEDDYPRMPAISGIPAPRPREEGRPPWRLSDNYYRLEGAAWVPQLVNDPSLRARVLRAGEARGWSLREQVVCRLLFDSGARLSEVAGLTFGDWLALGLQNTTRAFDKGSRGRRVKRLRFSHETAKLLRRYVDTERAARDPEGRGMARLEALARRGTVDPDALPLFLNQRGDPLTARAFREHHWNPAMAAAGLAVGPHQARHWYVTQSVRHIHETARDQVAVAAELKKLVAYMAWRSGEAMLEVYEHAFAAEDHARVQDDLHARWDADLAATLAGRALPPPAPRAGAAAALAPPAAPDGADDDDFAFLTRLGGAHGPRDRA